MSDASLFDMHALDTSPRTAEVPGAAATTHSLYRKYRPTSFADDDLVGQEHVVNTLRNAIALGRISHAYLFCGPRGTGKTTTARLLAKAVNCLDPEPANRPCNTCEACRAINAGATTDVIEIDAASNRGIDDIRDLRERVKYAPTHLKTKFYIIDEAHQITGAAANAFLKTLEEPPAHTRFVLATTDPEELLPTIVSRCQRFDFRRINLEAMVGTLQRVAKLEGIQITDDALPVIARQATGSLRDALGMLDQVAMYRESADAADGPISADAVRAVLGVSRNERVETLARALADQDAGAGLREINAAVEAGDDMRQLGRQLVAYLRLLMLQRAGGAPDADATAIEIAERFSMDELAALIQPMADLDFRMRRSSIPQLPLEIAMVEGAGRGSVPMRASQPAQTAAPDPHPVAPPVQPQERAPEQRVSLKDRVRGKPSPATDFAPAPEPPPSPREGQPVPESRGPEPAPDIQPATVQRVAAAVGTGPGGMTLERIVELWPQIRADVKALNRRIEALLQQVDPAAVTGSKLVLVSPYEFHRNRVNNDDVRQVIEGVVGRLLNDKVQVSCVSREEVQSLQRVAAPQAEAVAPAGSAGTTPVDSDAEAVPEEAPPREGSPLSEEDVLARLTAARNIFDADDVVN